MNIDIDKKYVISQPYCHSDLVLRNLTFLLNTVVLKETMFYLTRSTVALGYKDHCVNATREYSPHIVKIITETKIYSF